MSKKIYVLDTNVYLTDYEALYKFGTGDIIIPLKVLEEVGAPEKTVFHCYSGDLEMAKYCVARGYVLSFAGTVTFKNAPELREAVKFVPDDLLLVETDSPFLAPTPHRGALNTPAQIANIVRFIADVRGVDATHIASVTSANTIRIFGSFE